jgi:hypothetical protein
MRKILAAGLLGVAVGCTPRVGNMPKPNRDLGAFAFNISTHRSDLKLGGTIAILPESVVVVPDQEICFRQDSPKGDRYQDYDCSPPPTMSKFRLLIDANQPAASTWTLAKTYPRTERVCLRYATNKYGQRTCVGFTYHTTFADSVFRGRLEIKRTSAE